MNVKYVPAGMTFMEAIVMDVAKNSAPFAFEIHKFGSAADIDTGDVPATIWDGACSVLAGPKIPDYTFSTTANITDIASSNAGDTQSVEVQGLDANWDLVTQFVTLTGQTVKQLTTPLIRAFRMINRGTTNMAGTVYLTTSGAARTAGVPTVGNTVRAIIKNGDNQTQMALYTVPRGYTMYIKHAWTSSTKANPNSPANVVVKVYRRSFEGVFRVTHTISLTTTGTSIDNRPYDIPISFEEREDLIYKVFAVSENDQGVSAGFHAVVIKNPD